MNLYQCSFLVLLAVVTLCRSATGAVPVTATAPVVEWTFEHAGNAQGWQPVNQLTNNVVAAGALTGLTTGGDPFWMSPSFQAQASNFPYVVVRMKLQRTDGKPFTEHQLVQLFWVARSLPGINESSSILVDAIGDGEWHDYTFAVGENKLWKDSITSLRLDPCCAADVQVAIDSVRLQTVPGKDLILFHGKTYDVVMSSNLIGLVYPLAKGVRAGSPIIISSRFNVPYSPPDPPTMLRFTTTEPPLVQPHKLIIHATTSNNIPLMQTWKFSDNAITVENQIKKYPVNEPAQWVCTFIRWPQTHVFAPNIEKVDREKATAGYTWRVHAGKSYSALKTFTVPYTQAVQQSFFDWLENRGPWGARAVTLRRKSASGDIRVNFDALHLSPYEGLEMMFISVINPPTGRLDAQGFELTIK